MPNVCHNTLVVFGEPVDIIEKTNADFSETYDCLFSKFFPAPENASEDWYMEMWGTERDGWFTEDWTKDNGENTLTLCFDSAWVPGTQFVFNLSKLYDSVLFRIDYYIYESVIAGFSVFKAGKVIEEHIWRGEDTDDLVANEYGKNIFGDIKI
jgi:hypothetical protein